MRDPRATYLHLVNLARDQAGTPEGTTAAELAAAMKAKYGPEVVEATPEPMGSTKVAYSTAYEHDLAIRIGTFLGLGTFKVGYAREDGKGTRWRDQVKYEGPQDLTELAAGIYQDHRKRMAEILEYVAHGYAIGAFPLPPSERKSSDGPELTAAQLAALRAGARAGEANRHQRPVPESHRLTTTPTKLEG